MKYDDQVVSFYLRMCNVFFLCFYSLAFSSAQNRCRIGNSLEGGDREDGIQAGDG